MHEPQAICRGRRTNAAVGWRPRRLAGSLSVNEVTTLERIREALLVEAFEGVERTADVYAFGAFQLLGALLDTASVSG